MSRRHFAALCKILGSCTLPWTLPPAGTGTCGQVGLSALVSDNGCNSEDHLAASRADMDGGGQVGQKELDRHRVVTVHDGALWEESQKRLRRRCRWPCQSSWREECALCWPQLRAPSGEPGTLGSHTHQTGSQRVVYITITCLLI